MTRNAIITYACYPEGTQWWGKARARMEEYAERCDARFCHLQSDGYTSVIDRGEHIAEWMMDFERCLILDADLIISRLTPNIFNEYPDRNAIYMALDGRPGDSKAHNRLGDIVALQAFWGSLGWTSTYHNAGVILCDSSHHDIFRGWKPVCPMMWPDQSNINYLARLLQIPINDLNPRWNRFSLNSGHDTNTKASMEAIVNTLPWIAHAAGHTDRNAAVEYFDKMLP